MGIYFSSCKNDSRNNVIQVGDIGVIGNGPILIAFDFCPSDQFQRQEDPITK
jgi:hypothetical protein